MARKEKGKRTGREAGSAARESACDLEDSPPGPAKPGWTGIVDAVRRSRYLQILLLLLIAGALLRLYQLGAASLWLDEATTLNDARRSLLEIWNIFSFGENTPPLFFLMEHGMLAFGESEAILRFVPALFGIATIPIFYLVGAELQDRKVGIIAAALLTFSPFAIFYSQEARAYAPMLFFFAVAFLFFLRAQRTGAWTDALLFGIFSSISFWTHLYALVPVAALIISCFGMKGREIQRDLRAALPMALSTLAFFLLSLPILLAIFQLFAVRTGGGPSFGVQGLDTIILTFVQISGSSGILALLLTALFIVGVLSLFPRDRPKALLLVFTLVFSLVFSVYLSYRLPIVPRYLIYLLAIFLPGIALAIRPACTLFPSRRLVYAALILALVINLPSLSAYYTTPQKDDWRGLAREVSAVAAPGDLLVAVPGYVRQPLDYYYRNETHGTLEYGSYTTDELEKAVASSSGHRVWLVVTPDIFSADPQGLVIAWLRQHSTNVWSDANGGIFLLKYSG